MPHKTPPTLRFQLVRLVAVSMLPVWLVSGVLLYYAYTSKCGQVTRNLQDTARYQSMLVDQELAKVQSSLLAFATSSAFDNRDFRHLHQRALKMLELFPGADLIVADSTGQQQLNSFRPFGSPLPKRKNPETVRKIFQTGKPVISDLFYGALTRRPLSGIDVPVTRDGKVLYDLAMTFPSDRIAAIIKKDNLPSGSFCSILDTRKILVAGSQLSQQFVGGSVQPVLRQALLRTSDGVIKINENLDGGPAIIAFSRSAVSGWIVVVGIPKSAVMTEIHQWVGWAIFGIVVISLFGVMLSVAYARRITQAINSLIGPALSIGRGEPAVVDATYRLKETGEVAEALAQASELIKTSNTRLRESERRYSALFANKINGMAHCRVITDESGKPVDYLILQVNDAYEQIIGIKREEIEGRRVRDVFPGVEHFEFDYIGELGRIALEGGEIKVEVFLETTRQYLSIYAYSPALWEFTAILSDITEHRLSEDVVKKSEERYRAVVEDLTETICRFSNNGIYTFVNESFCRIVDKKRNDLLGKTWFSDAYSDDIPMITERLALLSPSNPVVVVENRIMAAEGEVRWMQFVNHGFFDGENRLIETQAVGRDITDRKNLELKLAESELKYRTLVMNAPFLVTSVDRNGVIRFINRCSEGFDCQTVLGTSSFDYLEGESKKTYRDALERVFETRSPQRITVKGFGDNHSLRWFESVLGPIVMEGSLEFAIQVSIDITERKRAEEMQSVAKTLLEQQVSERTKSLTQAVEQLHQENEQRKRIEQDLLENQRKLESMSIDLSLAEERERDRIAGELHDQVGQRLIFGKMILDALVSQVSDETCRNSAEELSRVMDLSIQDIRSLTFQLRPPLLASAGLEAALHWLGEEFREKYGLLLTFSDDGQQKTMRYETRSCIFQAVREILLNTVKHANATQIGIDIMRDAQLLKLLISDNGCGFTPSPVRTKTSKSGGFGLFNVQQRIEHLGGHFSIESSPGNGTCVTISVPIDNAGCGGQQ